MGRQKASDSLVSDTNRLVLRRLLLRPFPYQWDLFTEPDATRLEFRRPTLALNLMAVWIVLIALGFTIPLLAGWPLTSPFVFAHIVAGFVGICWSIRRIVFPWRIVLRSTDRVADLSGFGWLATGGAHYLIGQVWLEVRPIVVGPRHFLGRSEQGFILLFRTPNEVIGLCMDRELKPVRAYMDRLQGSVDLRVEIIDRAAITTNI